MMPSLCAPRAGSSRSIPAVAEGAEVMIRLAADHAYIDALRRGKEPVDARLSQGWLSGPYQASLQRARHANG